ncbi:ATPase WRNIP1 [Stegostoma tigrinum]|uniref:ATPase WRNIP1 n=1 Tax=Stegostoma tigrinum TaxID=3053191 RepID=UPI00202B4E03|nr:ATPase WRNIP1 [Stegostoma tigrinum]XP_048405033.1 ATPase WRNIP1 [Stegostoma tigrinum]
MALMQGGRESVVQCPVCSQQMQSFRINAHLDHCLGVRESDGDDGEPGSKRARLSSGAACGDGTSLAQSGRETAASGTVNDGDRSCSASPSSARGCGTLPGQSPSTAIPLSPFLRRPPSGDQRKTVSLRQLEAKPLAEIMRPSVLAELIGQNKVLGENTLLRTLLESHEIPSIILWGPPGCGKTSLAHVLASNSKKQSSTRFVSLSATSASTDMIREVVKQAQNELKLFKRKTIAFFDEIHHFNKIQQNTLLPHVECGTITLIGATTENPSFQINSALLSRCRVIVLEKLSVEAMETILLRALNSLGISILGQDKEAGSVDGSKESELHISVEPEAIRSIACLCDGDARAALNGLHLAIQAKVAEAKKPQNNFAQQSTLAKKILIKEMHIKEGLQRSHILYDRAGEEHYNCISALHKTMRASDEKAALYWLARMLEGGEDPLYVARRLVRFASEDVGLADPLALTQAVSAYQGCHFIGMPECEVILAQCVTYLSRAPKSVEIYMAYDAVKESLRNHKGPLPSVPLHLRNAPTKLMKDLGYGKDCNNCFLNKPDDNPSPIKE